MYDQDTIRQILSAPKVEENFDLESMPKILTNSFARTISTRLRSVSAVSDSNLSASLEYLNRTSASYEAYATLLTDQAARASAAFIAASSYQAISEDPRYKSETSYISISTVSPNVCAALLFLLAEAHADANEAAKSIIISPENDPVEAVLLDCIRNLALGNIIKIIETEIPDLRSYKENYRDMAFRALLYLLICGIKFLAKMIIGDDHGVTEDGISNAKKMFLKVKNLSSHNIDSKTFGEAPVLNMYGGPLHLASLLIGIEEHAHLISLGMVRGPDQISRKAWNGFIRKIALQRPYLWRNHRDAIEQGYLTPGVSSAISFPTGAGKSTLTELKIAASLLLGKRIVFLAPTNALVEQTRRSLEKTFDNINVYFDMDHKIPPYGSVTLSAINVMTPERCLMNMSIDEEAFSDVGLIVLDECHILHSDDENYSRRGFDAMLVILNLTSISPGADLLLLSAMMKNTDDISEWISELTNRKCLSLKLSWKPTRQVRGCVVYPAEKINELNRILAEQSNIDPTPQKPPIKIQRQLKSEPNGLFSLYQTWQTKQISDYALLPLLLTKCQLSTSKKRSGNGWYLTPNGNEVSREISSASSRAGMKTLVFVQTIVFCEGNVKKFRPNKLKEKVVFTQDEKHLFDRAAQEMGGEENCYLELDSSGALKSGAVSHHGLLLPEERNLHESLFNRRDGVDVVFATPTLAQGMNLPSQMVIISGDNRFDPEANKTQKLEAHELLNAAGRAGRAGQHSQGVVILIPSKVIDYDDTTGTIGQHWMDMKAIFEQSDQCLNISDPIKYLLDYVNNLIEENGSLDEQICSYFLRRLSFTVRGDETNSTETYLRRSFCAFMARKRNNEEWLNARIDTAAEARRRISQDKLDNWIERISSSTGFSSKIIQDIDRLIENDEFGNNSKSAVNTILDWLQKDPLIVYEVLNMENIKGMFGGQYKNCKDDQIRAEYAINMFRDILPVWMSGAPLCDVEMAHTMRSRQNKKCRSARYFSLRIASDFGFFASLPGRIFSEKRRVNLKDQDVPLVLATLGSVVREGCDSPEALATQVVFRDSFSRVGARGIYERLRPFIPSGNSTESFNQTIDRINYAIAESISQ